MDALRRGRSVYQGSASSFLSQDPANAAASSSVKPRSRQPGRSHRRLTDAALRGANATKTADLTAQLLYRKGRLCGQS
jgi:hypothetical protein